MLIRFTCRGGEGVDSSLKSFRYTAIFLILLNRKPEQVADALDCSTDKVSKHYET